MTRKALEEIVLATAVLVIVAVAKGVDGKPTNPLAGAPAAQHIFGPDVKPEDVKGKVVFFEYWGINCPPCRASFPQLVQMQRKYAPSGRFTVIGSHVQAFGDNVTAFLKQNGVNFPVFQQLRLPAAPCGSGIPSAYLFDHNGKIVARGDPLSLYGKVEALVRAALVPLSPMTEGLEIKYFRAQAVGLVPGKPVAGICRVLEARVKADKEDAAEAKVILDKVKGWITGETERLEKMVAKKPAKAFEDVKTLANTARGMPECEKATEMLAKLQKDPNVAWLSQIYKSVEKWREKVRKDGNNQETRQQAALLKRQLEEFQNRKGLSEALAAEAKALGESLDVAPTPQDKNKKDNKRKPGGQ